MPAEMPKVETEVVLWGDDPDLAKWLNANGIKTRAFTPGTQNSREMILVGNRPAAGEAEAFRELARHIARGSNVVFLNPDVFKKGDNAVGWLPLANKGTLASDGHLALSQGRLGEEPSDFRRSARGLHPGTCVLPGIVPGGRTPYGRGTYDCAAGQGRTFRPKRWPARSTRPSDTVRA